jgi:dephospho-CoA kinase
MFRAAVTGDVGAGKSTLVKTLASLGANVIDADEIAKSQWAKPEVIGPAAERWGSGVFNEDGTADFRAIAGFGFADEGEYRFMNSLVHPGANADIRRVFASLRGLAVLEIPLLFEGGRQRDLADYIIYVSAPERLRVERNSARGWDAGEIARRERFMKSGDEKKKMSDIVLVNDGDEESWARASKELGLKLLDMSSVHEVSTCCGSRADAERIAAVLVERHLAACFNIHEAGSCYFWKGKIFREDEWALSCKTTERALGAAIACIRDNHTYELPAVTAVELSRSDPATLEWIAESCEGFQKGRV